MSHYTSGFRVLDISIFLNPTESAFFDVYPSNNNTSFDGTWSNYPYYPSGSIVVTGIDEGFLLLIQRVMIKHLHQTVPIYIPSEGSVTLNWQDLIGDLQQNKYL